MVNDRHPSGVPSPDDPGSGFSYGTYDADYGQPAYGAYSEDAYQAGSHDGYPTGIYDTSGGSYADGSGTSYGDDDPLFGTLPGTDVGSCPTASWEAGTAWGTGSYSPDPMATGHIPAQAGPEQTDGGLSAPGFGAGHLRADDGTGQWTFGVQETGGWDTTTWGTGGWDAAGTQTGGWTTDGQGTAYGYENHEGYTGYEHAAYDGQAAYNGQAAYDGQGADGQAAYDGYDSQHGSHAGHSAPADHSGHGNYEAHDSAAYEAYESYEAYETYNGYGGAGGHEQPGGHGLPGYGGGEESAYGAEAGYGSSAAQFEPDHHGFTAPDQGQDSTAQWDFSAVAQHEHGHEQADESPYEHDFAPGSDDEWDGHDDTAAPPAALGTVGGPHGRGRRRSPKPRPRRRALMTVAVPSVAVMGVAGAAAASVMGDDNKDSTTVAAPDAAPVKPSSANSKLDTQLQGLSADADDFADRASRTQERIDLKQRQEAEKERKAKEAARKEAMRPKFAIPVKDHSLSARYGQAGVNWMSIHTGIDFPVSYGTPVMAATDGVVSTKHDVAYGNMAVVTAKDGTETWYCHLSSNKIRSGEVKAGDVIAYSGNSGNSTGPHLHFEVHPGGGSAVDPIPWLQSKGLNIS
ncbi:M23 family metallopeptidase [Streptomyces smyrnaeus]|uniref:M23 family metallopeptidase n=1 Tax=Streptomyces smyrnaeus TaxID=1387713 RepID=UPI0033EDB11B